MTSAIWVALLPIIAKYGFDVGISIIDGIKHAKTWDDAIAALEVAKTKTAGDYLKEAKESLGTPIS